MGDMNMGEWRICERCGFEIDDLEEWGTLDGHTLCENCCRKTELKRLQQAIADWCNKSGGMRRIPWLPQYREWSDEK